MRSMLSDSAGLHDRSYYGAEERLTNFSHKIVVHKLENDNFLKHFSKTVELAVPVRPEVNMNYAIYLLQLLIPSESS